MRFAQVDVQEKAQVHHHLHQRQEAQYRQGLGACNDLEPDQAEGDQGQDQGQHEADAIAALLVARLRLHSVAR